MPEHFLYILVSVFFGAVVIHLLTHLLMGPRADTLPGGAIAFALYQSVRATTDMADGMTANKVLVYTSLLVVALLGHWFSLKFRPVLLKSPEAKIKK